MEVPPVGDEASREERRGDTLCLHYFFGSTEKQDVRDLLGLPRSRDPGEGELAVYELGWGTQRNCVWDLGGDRRVRVYVGGDKG